VFGSATDTASRVTARLHVGCGRRSPQPIAETCDDGDTSACGACNATCTGAGLGGGTCGDGFTCGTEQCDAGTAGDTAACDSDCTLVVCGDGHLNTVTETCDEGNATPCGACNATCTGPGVVCGDGITCGAEMCDDADMDNTNGCTSQCKNGVICNAASFPGGDRFAVDPATGHCYVSYDDEQTSWADAANACIAAGGQLVTITSASRRSRDVRAKQHTKS
jgi:hypothetical protein